MFLERNLGEPPRPDTDPAMVRIDLGSFHCGPSVPPSVPSGPPNIAMAHQPRVDRVLLEVLSEHSISDTKASVYTYLC